MPDKRNYGLDLYKTLCMFLVIAFHFSDHGRTALSATAPLTFSWMILASSRIWGGVCNCCFMLVSGYFLSGKNSFSWKNVIKLYGQVWFYSVSGYAASLALGTVEFGIMDLIKAVLPFTFNRYWYFSTYIVVYLIHPYINRMLDTLTKKQHKVLCILSLAMFSLYYTFTHAEWIIGTNRLLIFIALYFSGAYIRKYGIDINRKKCVVLGIGMLILSVLSLICMKIIGTHLHMDNVITYFVWGTEKILPVCTSILLFLSFEKIRVKQLALQKCIGFIAPSLFGVYLLHIGDLQTWLFMEAFNNELTYLNGLALFGQLLLAMITIFIAGIAIDKIRVRLIDKMDNKTNRYVD